MHTEKARPTRQGGSRKLPARTAGENASSNSHGIANSPVLGDGGVYHCGGCNHEADYAYRVDRYTKGPTWFVGNSFTTRCPKGAECLRRHVEWLGELGIAATP